MAHDPFEPEQRGDTEDALEHLRDAVASAGSSPSAIGWQTEHWLSHREQMLHDMRELLTPESIEAEMRVREDVPRLLAQLAAALRGGAR
ncbi:MAG TPA: hypothetical protein VFR63_14735 [Gaiellaceae bacterium]|nr:hypothetical protein [Gaiellaceae bacterium]